MIPAGLKSGSEATTASLTSNPSEYGSLLRIITPTVALLPALTLAPATSTPRSPRAVSARCIGPRHKNRDVALKVLPDSFASDATE
jgi:hypothetical protein